MKAVRDTTTKPVINFLKEIFDNFGVARRIISDRGSCFTSKQFADFGRQYNIKLVLNATASPRANGQVERFNRTILSALGASMNEEERWDELVAQVRWGLNTTVNSATGKSPYELLFGFVPRGAAGIHVTNELDMRSSQDTKVLREDAERKIVQQQKGFKGAYDAKRCKAVQYKTGQQVLIRKRKASNDGRSRKLLPKYDGPFVVTKVLPADRYVIQDLPGSSRTVKPYTGIIAADNLKPYEGCMAEEEGDNSKDYSSSGREDRGEL